jgi:hypothetical protein
LGKSLLIQKAYTFKNLSRYQHPPTGQHFRRYTARKAITPHISVATLSARRRLPAPEDSLRIIMIDSQGSNKTARMSDSTSLHASKIVGVKLDIIIQ